MSEQSYTQLRAERRRTLDALKLQREHTDELEVQRVAIEHSLGMARIIEKSLERHEERLAEQIKQIETSHADGPQT